MSNVMALCADQHVPKMMTADREGFAKMQFVLLDADLIKIVLQILHALMINAAIHVIHLQLVVQMLNVLLKTIKLNALVLLIWLVMHMLAAELHQPHAQQIVIVHLL